MAATLMVNEIYPALQGEGLRAGRPCALVRLTGCNLRCRWCDTRDAYEAGQAMPPEAVLAEVGRIGLPLVLVTGGEPLLQAGTPALLAALCDAGYEVLVQTNGSIDVGGLDPRVVRCIDCKCPQSGAGESFCPANFGQLRAGDELKFILAGREDYEFARRTVAERGLAGGPNPAGRCAVIFTPAEGLVEPAELAEWILRDRLNVRLGVQLHKVIWPGVERGV